MADSTRAMAASSAADSCPVAVAATRTACDVDPVWKVAARLSARTLGSVDGRNWELLLFSTLEIPGRPNVRATVPTTHATTISQRKRTVKRPSEAKEMRRSDDKASSLRPCPSAA